MFTKILFLTNTLVGKFLRGPNFAKNELTNIRTEISWGINSFVQFTHPQTGFLNLSIR